VHHVLTTLSQEGLLAKGADRRYRMGAKIGVLAAAFAREQAVPTLWQRALAGLAASTGETAYLAGWRSGEIRILAGLEGSRAVRVAAVQVGSYADAHARATGKLLLALASPGERAAYLARHPLRRLTAKTITNHERLETELERIRGVRYATDDEEFAEGLACLSVPIVDGTTILGAFTVSAPSQRFRAERRTLLEEARRAAAEAVEEESSRTRPSVARGAQ
jgi:DNA-binding IclR family transcriptional regulator